MGIYFSKPGPENTETCLELVKKAVLERGIKHVVVASTYGDTGLKAVKVLEGLGVNLVIVTHNFGFKEPGSIEMTPEMRKKLEEMGAKVYTGSLVFRSVGSAIRSQFGYSEEVLIASVLRLFGQGMKVCVEITLMASDAGLIPPEDVIAVAGTARGADTVVILKAVPSNMFFNLKIREILAKPRDW